MTVAAILFINADIRPTTTMRDIVTVHSRDPPHRLMSVASASGTPASTVPTLSTNIAPTVMTAGLLKPLNASPASITFESTRASNTSKPTTSGLIRSLAKRTIAPATIPSRIH